MSPPVTPRGPSLAKFVLLVLLWLPACFAAWHLGAARHASLAAAVAGFWVEQVVPGLVSGIERSGVAIVFVTEIEVRPAPGQVAVLVPEVDPRPYTYGLALFVALMLASRARPWKILLGAALLLPFQGWSIAFDFLAQVGIRQGAEIAAKAGLWNWRGELVALGYQLGTLMFPAVVPALLWAVLDRGFIARMAPAAVFGGAQTRGEGRANLGP